MASIYDINAAIQKPNMLAAVQQGYVFGTQQRQQREDEQRQNMLRGLAPKVIEGDPNAYAQAAAIDPQAAQTYDNAGTNQLRKLKGFVDYVDRARASGNPQAVNAALRTGAPFLSQFLGGRPPPTEWTPDMDAGWEQLKAKVSMLGSDPKQEPAGYRQAHLTAIAAGYQPGTPEYQRAMQVAAGTAPRAIPPGYTTRSYRDANGQEVVELVQIRGEGAGQQMPAGAAPAPQPAPSSNGDPKMDAIVKAANDMRAAGIPTAQIDAWMQQLSQKTPGVEVGATQPMPAGGPAPMPAPAPARPTLDRVPINDYGGGAMPAGRGQTDADRARAAAEQAAMVEQARLRAQLSLAPQQAAADAEAARLKKEAEAAGERAAQAPKRIANYRQALTASQNVVDAIDKSLSSLSPASTGFLGARTRGIEGSPAYNLAANIETVKANLGFDRLQQMRDNSPTGGALGAIAVQELIALQSTIANLDPNQSEPQIRANLEKVKTHYRNWMSSVEQALRDEQGGQGEAPAGGQVPVEGARQAPDGNWYVQQNGRWFRVEQ